MINSSERTLFPSFFCSRSVFRVNLDGEGKMKSMFRRGMDPQSIERISINEKCLADEFEGRIL